MTTRRYRATPVSADAYTLGEGPVWDPLRDRLLWVDISEGKVYAGRLDPFEVIEEWSFESTVGAVAVAEDGTLLVAEREVLTRVDPGGARTEVARVLTTTSGSRLNDGAVDPAGRFLVGSLPLEGESEQEILVRLEGGKLTLLDGDLHLSNGLTWAGNAFYSIDTLPRVVHVREYDPIGPRRDAFHVAGGQPDGMCLDAEGNLWIAVWGGGRVERRTPAGDLLAVVEVAAPHTTSVAFAGPGLDTLVITSATDGLSPAELAAHPDSGRVFTARVDVAGPLPPYWNPAL